MKEYHKEYSQKNKVRISARMKKWHKEYYQRLGVKVNINFKSKKRYAKDIKFRIIKNLRRSLLISFKRYSKTGKIMTSKKYGIDFKAIIKHLKPFPKDIKNYHIDHIIPLSLFDFNNLEHIKIAFAPSNHQWLTIKENLEKHDRLVMPH